MNNEKDYGEGAKGTDTSAKEQTVFAQLTKDNGFKIVLGSEGKEGLLIKLINSILPELKIVSLRYLPTEHLGPTVKHKKSVFDVYAKDEKGRRFLIEMQLWPQKYFEHRSTYYAILAVNDQAREEQRRQKKIPDKDWDYYFKPSYVISFVNFKNDYIEKEAIASCPYTEHCYLVTSSGKGIFDKLNIYYVDLYSFNKEFEECANEAEEWLYSLKNMHALKEMPEGVKGTPLEELYNEARIAAWKPEITKQYTDDMDKEYDFRVYLQQQVEVSHEEGKKEGREENMVNVVQKFTKSGMTTKELSNILQVPVKELDELLLKSHSLG